jgi:hypothetical protein
MNVRAQGPIIAVPRRWNSCLGILTIGMAWVMGSPAGPARGEGTAPGIAPAPGTALGGQPATSRIIHRFDFFEPNYFDPIPPGWVRFPDGIAADPEFPRYADARFDPDAGHVAPPSFYLASRGRSVAYRYVGDATRVRRGDYAVTGWVRPDRLARGRATLSAYYLDWEGQYVPGTQRFGRLIGSDPADASTGREDDWAPIRIRLPSAPLGAHFVGITCWVVQEEVWHAGSTPHRHIGLRDVSGGAWFDDISVRGLPRGVLSSRHAGHVATVGEPFRLVASIADQDVAGLSGKLTVHNFAGAVIAERAVAAHDFEMARAQEFALDDLSPGIYSATLVARSLGEPVVETRLSFAVTGEPLQRGGPMAEAFGLNFPSAPTGAVDAVAELVTHLGVGTVKLPMWSRGLEQPAFDAHRDALHVMLDRLVANRLDIVGVFGGPPTSVLRAGGAHAPRLIEFLNQDPRSWRAELNGLVAPYATIVHAWQIGDDRSRRSPADARVTRAVRAFENSLIELMPEPHLVTVRSLADAVETAGHPTRTLSLTAPPDLLPDQLRASVTQADATTNRWLTIPGPELHRYDRSAELDAWLLRMIAARSADVQRVFTPVPWTLRATAEGVQVQPTEAYPLLHTLVDLINDQTPIEDFYMGESARAMAFGDGALATLVAWDPYAPDSGHEVTLQLGAARESVDRWGRRTPIARTGDGRHRLLLTRSPRYIPGIEQWLVRLQALMQLTPARIPAALDPQAHNLRVVNPRDVALAGEITFAADEDWEIEPSRIAFALQPGEVQDIRLDIRQPRNQPAGRNTVHAHIQLHSDPKYLLDIPLRFEIGLADVDVWGYAINEGDRVRVRHGVTNRSSERLSFRAFAMLEGAPRQYRRFDEILPGQTLSLEYLFGEASDATGKAIRLGLREVNGRRRHNLETRVP